MVLAMLCLVPERTEHGTARQEKGSSLSSREQGILTAQFEKLFTFAPSSFNDVQLLFRGLILWKCWHLTAVVQTALRPLLQNDLNLIMCITQIANTTHQKKFPLICCIWVISAFAEFILSVA